ncbi:MAG TPA: PD-(D/E)XK nuclease family protein [Anaerolineaceae bacterium]|nr:PD-(D/E)XK nuclease family protein [Anaerolineaceae bacterium]
MIPDGFAYSQSSLQSYLNCPRQFELRYLQKLTWPAQKYADTEKYELDMAAGQCLHQAIHRFLLGFDKAVILESLQNGKDPRIPIWFNNFQSRLGHLKEKADFIAEIPVSIPFEMYLLTAKFDYICFENEQTTIFDWKTSARKPRGTQLAESMQTKVYVTVAQRFREKSEISTPKMRYWEANYPDLELSFAPDTKTLGRYESELKALIYEIGTQTEFPMTQSVQRCVYCKYRSYCNRGALPGEAASDEDFEQMVSGEMEEIRRES